MKILLITGGDSSERKISLLSARNVKKALGKNGHKVKLYDLKHRYESIRVLAKQYDILFPVLHGEEGEGGKLHKFLSKINKPIVGTRNYKGLQNAWYKIPFKKYCDKYKIKTSPWKIVKSKKDIVSFGFPCVLKLSSGGSAHEVVIIKTANDLNKKEVNYFLNGGGLLFVEKYLPGTEVTVGILNGKALPVIEIIPPENSWFSYKNRYNNKSKEIPFAPSIDKKIQRKLQRLTLKIHNHFNLDTFSRSDFMIYKNKHYILEINTIPGLTDTSLMPKAAEAAGINFSDFLEILLKSAK